MAVLLSVALLPTARSFAKGAELMSVEKYVDKIDSAANAGQRSDTFNISLLSDNVGAVGDTSRAVFGANPGATESYLDYSLKEQDTAVVYLYEKILTGNKRPQSKLPKFSVIGTNWETEPTQTEVEIGRSEEPVRYTRIKLTYKLDSPLSDKTLRIHIYPQSEPELLQLGRVELYNSASVQTQTVKINDSKFSVSGWITPPEVGESGMSDSVDFENAMTELAASGINFNLPNVWSGDNMYYRKRLTDVCAKLGIKTLVYDESLISYLKSANYNESSARAMVAPYANDESFAGHFIMDEPNYNELDSLKVAAERYSALLPNKIFYVNLFPNYAISEYEEYLNKYFDTIGENRISYDYYVLEGRVPSEYKMKTTHLLNLQTAAVSAKEHNAELYAIIASTGHYNPSDKAYLRNISSKADLGFQAYSALAYGVKGLTWFTYLSMANGEFGAQPGMFDLSGNKTKVYDYVQEINSDISFFADIYLDYGWTGTMLIEGSACEKNANFESVKEPLREHKAIKSVQTKHDVIAGTFFNGKNDALLLANYNDPSLNVMPEITVNFDKPYLLKIYANGTKKEVRMKSNSHTFYLGNGGGAFIELFELTNEPTDENGSNGGESEKPSVNGNGTQTPAEPKKSGCSANVSSQRGVAAIALGAVTLSLIIGVTPKKIIRRKLK